MADVVGFVLAVILGFVPMLFLAGILYWLDRYEKEPKLLLSGVFAWGAIVAVIGALIAQILLGQGVLILTGSAAAEEIASSSLFAPLTEEIFKGLAVLLIFIFFRYEFDSVLDGIIYAGVVALGFAATEDVLYYFSSYAEDGLGGMLVLVFLRFVIFGWQHAFFTAFIGIGLAVTRLSKNILIQLSAPLVGLGLAIFVHSLHNSLLTFLTGMAGLSAAVLFAWTGWLMMGAFIFWLIYREKRWLSEHLREEVQLGVISNHQFQSASELFGQTRASLAALGDGRFHQTRRFFQLCGELAHKKRQLASLGDEQGNQQLIASLRAELAQLSAGL